MSKALTAAEFAAIALALGPVDDFTLDRAYGFLLLAEPPSQPSWAVGMVRTALASAGWIRPA